MSLSGGVAQDGIANPDDCLAMCAADDACLGANVAPGRSTLCWFHTDLTGNRRPTSGVTLYVLVDRCPQGQYKMIILCCATKPFSYKRCTTCADRINSERRNSAGRKCRRIEFGVEEKLKLDCSCRQS